MTDKKVLIFAGTTEGRRLAEILLAEGVPCCVCVATEYGSQVMKEHSLLELLQGRLDVTGMERLMRRGDFCAVVDATHPYAVEVSKNIREGAASCGLEYLRLKRNTKKKSGCPGTGEALEDLYYFPDNEACAEFLRQKDGNILLTTGSKELSVYCKEHSLKERLYVRVLPGMESIGICEKMEIPGKQIIALQGPFSEELNYVLLKQYQVKWLVTKESGAAGGYEEKLLAAKRGGACVCVIGSPSEEEGLSFDRVCGELGRLYKKAIHRKRKLLISLIGVGMGDRENLTVEAWEAYNRSEYVFGAKRLLEIGDAGKCYPYYLAEDILPCLEEILKEDLLQEEIRVSVLFSGDTGFYSGCDSLYAALQKWAEPMGDNVIIRIYPGISSVSYLAAATGYSWQDAAILSVHGKADWEKQFVATVQKHAKTFVLTSGGRDVRMIGRLLEKMQGGSEKFSLFTGYRLSYADQEVVLRTPEECGQLEKEGIYTCLVLNSGFRDHECPKIREQITHGLPDADFIRGEVPMTKEEVREVVISKLHLTRDAVVYDIGSGTGSVAVEIAKCSPKISVYALEHKETGVELIRKNVEKFGVSNLTVVQTHAPEGLDRLPAPTHVFIGGSDGCMKQILEQLQTIKRASIRVVITAVSLETLAEVTDIIREMQLTQTEIVNLQVSRSRALGRYHLMQAENPVTIVAFDL